MLNPRLAARYAKSVVDLSIERGQLDEVYNDMLFLQSVIKNNKDFATLLKSPVINADKKQSIIEAVAGQRIVELTRLFIGLLIRKGRESNLAEIAQAFIDQYKQKKEIHTVKLTTAAPVSEEVKRDIVEKVKSSANISNVELTSSVDEGLIGGFVLQIGDKLVDASIAYDLNAIKKQFLNNDFIYKIR